MAEKATKWVADFGEASACEIEDAMELVGIKASQHDERPMSVAAALAVVVARQDDPSIPEDEWRRIKMRNLTIIQPDPEDDSDPT